MNGQFWIGTIAGDAKLNAVKKPSGEISVVEFGLYDNHVNKKNGAKANYAYCEYWGERAKAKQPLLQKGALVSLKGTMKTWEQTSPDGKKTYGWKVVVDDLEILRFANPKGNGNGNGDESQKGHNSEVEEIEEEFIASVPSEEDLF